MSTYEFSWDTNIQSITGADPTICGVWLKKLCVLAKQTNKQKTQNQPNPKPQENISVDVKYLKGCPFSVFLMILAHVFWVILPHVPFWIRMDGNTFPSKYNSVLYVDQIDLFNILF